MTACGEYFDTGTCLHGVIYRTLSPRYWILLILIKTKYLDEMAKYILFCMHVYVYRIYDYIAIRCFITK